MPIQFNLKKYINPIFIETGTYIGDGVKEALDCGFETIYSIEIDYNRFLNCTKMFEKNDNVIIIYGDSGVELPKLLKKIDKKVTFWIDAHYSADGAYIGDKWCPIKEEFEAIKDHHINDHTILIDDWRCMDLTHIDYSWIKQVDTHSNITVNDKKGKQVGFIGKKQCFETLKNINENYKFSFETGVIENDVLICQI